MVWYMLLVGLDLYCVRCQVQDQLYQHSFYYPRTRSDCGQSTDCMRRCQGVWRTGIKAAGKIFWCCKRIQYSAFSHSACLENATICGTAMKAHSKVQYIHWAHLLQHRLLHHSILGFNRHCRKDRHAWDAVHTFSGQSYRLLRFYTNDVVQQIASHEHACCQAVKHLEGFCFIGISTMWPWGC